MPSAVAEGLRLRGVDVTTTADARLGGAVDEKQLAFATAEGRVMVTYDRDYVRLNAQGVRHAGIAFLPKRMEIGAIIEGLLVLVEVFTADEMRNQVQYI